MAVSESWWGGSVQRAIRWSDQFSLTPANTLVWYGMVWYGTSQHPPLSGPVTGIQFKSHIWISQSSDCLSKPSGIWPWCCFPHIFFLCFLPSGFDRLNLNPLLQRCICCIPIEKDPNHWKCILPRFTASHFSLSLLFKINLSLKGSP